MIGVMTLNLELLRRAFVLVDCVGRVGFEPTT